MIAIDSSHLLSDPSMIWLADTPALPEAGPIAQVLPWLVDHLQLPIDPRALARLDASEFARDPGRVLQMLQQLGCDTQVRQTRPHELVQADLPAVLTLATGDTCVVTAVHGRPGTARQCEVVIFAPEPMAFTVTDVELASECTGPAWLVRRAKARTAPVAAVRPARPAAAAPQAGSAVASQRATPAPQRPAFALDAIPVLHDVVEVALPRAATPAPLPADPPAAAAPRRDVAPSRARPAMAAPVTQAAPATAATPMAPVATATTAATPRPVTTHNTDTDVVLDLGFLDRHSGATQMRRQLVQRLRMAQGWVAWSSRSIRARWLARCGVRSGEVLLRASRLGDGCTASLGEWLQRAGGPAAGPGVPGHPAACAASPGDALRRDQPRAGRQDPFLGQGGAMPHAEPYPLVTPLSPDVDIDTRWRFPDERPAASCMPALPAQPPSPGVLPFVLRQTAAMLSNRGSQALAWVRRGSQAMHQVVVAVTQRPGPSGRAWMQWVQWPGWAPATRWPQRVSGLLTAAARPVAALLPKPVPAWRRQGSPGPVDPGLAADSGGPIPAVATSPPRPSGPDAGQGRPAFDLLAPARSRWRWRASSAVHASGQRPCGPPAWAPWLGALPVDDWRRAAKALPLRTADAILEALMAAICLAQGLPLAWGRAWLVDGLWAPLRQEWSRPRADALRIAAVALSASGQRRAQRPSPLAPASRTVPPTRAAPAAVVSAALAREYSAATVVAHGAPGSPGGAGPRPHTPASMAPAPASRPPNRVRVYAADFASALRRRSEQVQMGPPRPPRLHPPNHLNGLPGHRLMAA